MSVYINRSMQTIDLKCPLENHKDQSEIIEHGEIDLKNTMMTK